MDIRQSGRAGTTVRVGPGGFELLIERGSGSGWCPGRCALADPSEAHLHPPPRSLASGLAPVLATCEQLLVERGGQAGRKRDGIAPRHPDRRAA
jgi:hypothetical protein